VKPSAISLNNMANSSVSYLLSAAKRWTLRCRRASRKRLQIVGLKSGLVLRLQRKIHRSCYAAIRTCCATQAKHCWCAV
jgi:hypothetical protein